MGTKNHQAVDPLYAWLTGETHTISVGNTTQTYYFDKKIIIMNSSLLQIGTLHLLSHRI